MFSNLSIGIASIFFMFIIMWNFFSKKHIESKELEIFKGLIVLNFAGLLIEIILNILIITINHQNIFIDIFGKLLSVYFIAFPSLLLIYIFAISLKKEIYAENRKKIISIIGIIDLLSALLIMGTKINFKYGAQAYSYGTAINITYIVAGIMISAIIITLLINIKHIQKRNYAPMVFFILGSIFTVIIQKINPSLTIATFTETLLLFIMYHTIENPDVIMLEEVQIAKESAEKANSSKTEFLSNMSHEIRTPLNAIVGFSESLKDDNISPEVENKIDDIITASNNLLEIVNGILDISKIEANKLELVNKEYDIKTTIDELESLTKARIGKRDLELKLKIDPSLPRILYGDNSRLKQIILNLLTNAVKYTKEGYINFVVSSVNKDDTCRLIISIEDTGIGIKQENINKLFSKFERLDVEKQITIEGTGLGLAITKKLVDLMGGTIVAQSVYGKGSKFTVSIDQKIISMNAKEEEKTTVKNEIIDVNGARTLIVDDNELNIKVATTLLKKYNFTIDSCTNGQECIKKLLEDDSYDIIFLDDMMPQMSGREVIKKLREAEGFNIPTIALTANAIEGMKDEYLECGFDDYISKPIERKEIERVIKTFLKSKIKENNLEPVMEEDEIIEEQPPKEISYIDCSDKHILLVDDSEIELKVTGNLLEKNKCQISIARSGSECIVKLIDKKYDLIIIDDTMPNLSGVDTIKNLEEIEGYETPIILLTNSKGQELADKITSKFIIGYLRKPVDKYELNELLKKVTKNKGDK